MFQFLYKKWIGGVVLFSLILLFISVVTIRGQSSSPNYKLKKSVADQGGAASQSTNFKLIESVGQPSPVSYTASANYKATLGFWGSVSFTEVNIHIPDDLTCDCQVNDTFSAPVIVEDVSGMGVFSYGLDVLYDSAHLDVVNVISTGTISSGTTSSDLLFSPFQIGLLCRRIATLSVKASVRPPRKGKHRSAKRVLLETGPFH